MKQLLICATIALFLQPLIAQQAERDKDFPRSLSGEELRSMSHPKQQKSPSIMGTSKGVPSIMVSTVYVDDSWVGSLPGSDPDGAGPATNFGTDAFASIQSGIDAVASSGTVYVFPGNYSEVASGRSLFNLSGPYQFGLFIGIAKDGISIVGVDASAIPITSYASVLANVETNATNSFGYSGIFLEANNVTIQGLKILPNVAGDNKTIEVIGDNATVKHCHFAISPDGGSLYFNDWRFNTGTNTSHVKSYTVDNNWFDFGTSIDIASGAGYSGPVSGRVITNNKFTFSSGQWWNAISFNGSGTGVAWFVYSVGGAVIQYNNFSGGEQYIRARGTYDNTQFDWASYWNDNTFDKAVIAGVNPPNDIRSWSYVSGPYTFNDVRHISTLIQHEVDHALTGDKVLAKAGTYEEQVEISKSISLVGAGAGSTIVKSPTLLTKSFSTGPNNFPVIYVHDADVVVKQLTVDGAGRGNSNYRFIGMGYRNAGGTIDHCEIKDIRESPINGNQHGVGIYAYANNGIARSLIVSENTLYGYQKNGTAFLGVDLSVSVTNNTVTGAGAVSFIAQNGIQLGLSATGSVNGNDVVGHSYTPFSWAASGILLYGADANTDGNTLDENQVGIYHIDGSGTHNGNTISASYAGTGSPGFWGIVADDPPANRLPQAFDQELINSIAGGGENLRIQKNKKNNPTIMTGVQTVVVSNNILTGDDYSGGTGVETDAGYSPRNMDFTATGNVITNWGIGVVIYQCTSGCTGTVFSNVHVNNNCIFSNTDYGMYTNVSPVRDAENNWWGSLTGPTHASNPSGTGDAVTDDIDFTPWLGATITAGGPLSFCAGGSVTLTASAGASYLWSNGATTQTITVSIAGSYSVTVTYISGCTSTSNPVTVTTFSVPECAIAVSPSPTVVGQTANTIFIGYGPQSVTLTASASNGTAPYSYVWDNGLGMGDTKSVSPATTTTYHVTVTDANGCTTTCEVTITVIDVRCGNNNNKVLVCHNGHTICVSANAVPTHLGHSDQLGNCISKQGGETLSEIPDGYVLEQNYPNPFNPTTEIRFGIPDAGVVSLKIFDALGAEIRTLVSAPMNAGYHRVQWDATDNDGKSIASGLYFYELRVGDFVQRLKMNLVK